MSKEKLYGIIGSALFCLLTFLILWFVMMPAASQQKEDDGIMVSFGDNLQGLGFGEMIAGKEEIIPAASLPKPETQKEEIITQKTEKSFVLPKEKKEKRQKEKTVEEDLQRKEQQRKAAMASAEAKKRQEAEARASSLMGNAFGNGAGKGSGTTSGDTRQGNPAGSGNSGGHSWSLNGRSLAGELATPSYPSNVEGKVTVNIRVDASGRVTNATVGSPTTISDGQTRHAAVSAAKNTRFSGGNGVSVGSITYNFKLK